MIKTRYNKILIIGVLLMFVVFLEAQPRQGVATNIDQKTVGGKGVLGRSGLMNVRTLLLDDFETADDWLGQMPRDYGIIVVKRREGGPSEVRDADKENNKYVLGARISYFKTGAASFSITPPREIDVLGVSKSISVWVAGRNYSHRLYALIRYVVGRTHKVRIGKKLNFPGWEKISGQFTDNVIQEDLRYALRSNKKRGIVLLSMFVECAMDETVGDYYFYMDQLQVETDMFYEDEQNRNLDDMIDKW